MIRKQVKIHFKRGVIGVFLLVVLAQITGCEEDRPKGIMSEKEMVKTMMEIYLAEEKASRLGIPYDSLKKIFPRLRNKILDNANVHDTVFQNSWNYYLNHPKRLEVIYTALIDSLNLKEQGYPAKSPTQTDALPE